MRRKFLRQTKNEKGFVTPFSTSNYNEILKYEEAEKEREKRNLTYKEFEEAYKALKVAIKPKKAYKVISLEDKEILYIAFTESKDKAIYETYKYYRDSFHPDFSKDFKCFKISKKLKATRIPEFDKYVKKGAVPIPALMETLNISFSCFRCKKYHFNYSDFEKKLCFIIEGEDFLNPYTEGLVFCRDCIKYFI